MSEGTRLDVEKLARDNDNLREQRQAVSDVLRAVASSEGVQAVLVEIVEAAETLSRRARTALLGGRRSLSHLLAELRLDESYDYPREHPHARDRATIVGRVGLTGAIEQIPDVLADADYSYEAQRMIGFRSLLGVTIVLDGELIGVIAVARNHVGTFAEGHVEPVRTFADQAAIAISNARLIAAVDRQRTELARYISPAVTELISSEQGEQLLAGHRAYITCLFCDLRGFTAFAETAAPEELLEALRAYHETLGDLLAAYEGTLEHFAGDGVMCSSTTASRSMSMSASDPLRTRRPGEVRGPGPVVEEARHTARTRNRRRGRLTRPLAGSGSKVDMTTGRSDP